MKHTLSWVGEHAAFYQHRLRDLVVDANGQVRWGIHFGWFLLKQDPGSDSNILRHIGGGELELPDDIRNAGSGEWEIGCNWDFATACLKRKNFERTLVRIFRDQAVDITPPLHRGCPGWLEELQKNGTETTVHVQNTPTPQQRHELASGSQSEKMSKAVVKDADSGASSVGASVQIVAPPPPPGLADPLGDSDDDD
jgi:hypothetical protein